MTDANKDVVLADDDLDELEALIADEGTGDEVPAKKADAKKADAKKGAAKKKAAAPSDDKPADKEAKAPRPTFDKQSDALFHKIGDAELALVAADAKKPQKKVREEVAEIIDGSAKKVQEKMVNLIAAATKGDRLSVYTEIALKELFKGKKDGVTSADLVKVYGENYSEGTSRAQAGQMMQLLPRMGIAVKTGKSMVLNETSVLADAIKTQLSA